MALVASNAARVLGGDGEPARLQIRPGSAKELEPQWDEESGNDYVI